MRIEIEAFFENQEIVSVDLPMGTTEIGSWAYSRCHKLQHVTLPVSVTNLGDGAFSCCPNLRTVVAPGVTSLGEGVFAFDENLERVEMPRVQRLPPATFRYCGNAHDVGVRAEVLEQLELAQQALGVLCVVEHATPPIA